ncbi:MAG: thymidine kinase [Alphaproteobacteria bacterium TMED87]|nr:MAG: thymidine kinase [Alphaproteobacteria bacterium TMED87]
MAKLYFSYSAMNAGKSTILLQASHNYFERGMRTMLITSNLDNRVKKGKITSRIGLSEDAELFDKYTNIYSLIDKFNFKNKISCVLIDEAQFLSYDQVWQLSDIVDKLKLPVMCYGLRTDFLGKLFSGSEILLSIADEIREIRTICHCGKKATMVIRQDDKGNVIKSGAQIEIGGNEKYTSLCRLHWKRMILDNRDD